MTKTAELLEERGKTHGDFFYHAQFTQKLKEEMYNFYIITKASNTPIRAVEKLDHVQCEALDMIFHKIGRILAGDPNFKDHWADIAGYAQLAAERCTK